MTKLDILLKLQSGIRTFGISMYILDLETIISAVCLICPAFDLQSHTGSELFEHMKLAYVQKQKLLISIKGKTNIPTLVVFGLERAPLSESKLKIHYVAIPRFSIG